MNAPDIPDAGAISDLIISITPEPDPEIRSAIVAALTALVAERNPSTIELPEAATPSRWSRAGRSAAHAARTIRSNRRE